MTQVEQDGGEQQREGNRKGDDKSAADVAEKSEEDDDDQNDSLTQVVEDGVRRVAHQVTAVEVRYNLYARRQNVLVQILHLRMERLKSVVGVGILAHLHDPFD